jgi:hypothetical protein
MIHDVDESLARLLTSELARVPGCPLRSAEQITFDPPPVTEAEVDGEARLNLYLFDLRENLERRQQSLHWLSSGPGADGLSGYRSGPILFDLYYLLTAYAGSDPRTEHRLLSDALMCLLRFRTLPAPYRCGEVAHAEEGQLFLTAGRSDQPQAPEARSIWQAVGGRMRPGITVVVTIPLDPFETAWTRRVRELFLVTRQAAPGPGVLGIAEQQRLRVAVAGIVVDQPTETPLQGVCVTTADSRETLLTDAAGFFVFHSLPAGSVTLHFHHSRCHEESLVIHVPSRSETGSAEPVVVALRALTDAEFARRVALAAAEPRRRPDGSLPEPSSCGILRLPDGRPAGLTTLRAGSRSTVTDRDGVYFFFDLDPAVRSFTAEFPTGETEIPLPDPPASAGPDAPTEAARK